MHIAKPADFEEIGAMARKRVRVLMAGVGITLVLLISI